MGIRLLASIAASTTFVISCGVIFESLKLNDTDNLDKKRQLFGSGLIRWLAVIDASANLRTSRPPAPFWASFSPSWTFGDSRFHTPNW